MRKLTRLISHAGMSNETVVIVAKDKEVFLLLQRSIQRFFGHTIT